MDWRSASDFGLATGTAGFGRRRRSSHATPATRATTNAPASAYTHPETLFPEPVESEFVGDVVTLTVVFPGGGVVVTVTGGEVVVTGGEVVVTGGEVVVTGGEVVVTGGEVVVTVTGGDVVVAGGTLVVGRVPDKPGPVPVGPLLAELMALDSDDPAWPFPDPQPVAPTVTSAAVIAKISGTNGCEPSAFDGRAR